MMGVLLVAMLLCGQGCMTGPFARAGSRRTIDQAAQFVKPAPSLDEVIHFMGAAPIIVPKGDIHFICANGDLWVQTERDEKGVERVTQWVTMPK